MPHTHPAPPEYLRLIFCRDVWHCPPDTFYAQDVAEYEDALTCLQVEAAHLEEQRKKNPPQKGRWNFFKRGKR